MKAIEPGVIIGIPKEIRMSILEFFTDSGEGALKPSDLRRLYKDFSNFNVSGELNYQEFLEFIGQEESDRTLEVFEFFDIDNGGTIDIKEFVTGLCNFTSAEFDERMKFIFKVFDEDESENIDDEELKEIISASFAMAGYLSD